MLKKKGGFATLITLIMLLVMLPLMLFAVVDIPFWLTANRRIQNIVDNASSGASTALDEQKLADGIIQFNESQAEMIILSQLQAYFELGIIPAITEGSYVQVDLLENTASYFQYDPIIIKMKPDTVIDINEIPYGTPIIEYAIHNPGDNFTAKTYILSSGQTISVYKPTIIVSVMTRVYAPAMLFPITMHKVSIQEVTLGPNR